MEFSKVATVQDCFDARNFYNVFQYTNIQNTKGRTPAWQVNYTGKLNATHNLINVDFLSLSLTPRHKPLQIGARKSPTISATWYRTTIEGCN